jgi:hypothetical protein
VQQTIIGITRWVTLNLWRDGGQRGARRNAWAGMASDSARSRQRAEVEEALRRLEEQPQLVAHR